MKIAVGLDYVTWKYQDIFKEILTSLKKDGHQIGILSSHTQEKLFQDLALWKKREFPELDFYIAKGALDEIISNSQWKLKKVEEQEIDVFIDNFDSPHKIMFHVSRFPKDE